MSEAFAYEDIARPLTLTIAAMGGQGGGVLQNWLVDIAESAGYHVQATSVPGVAQRTGATIYYLEFYPSNAQTPVMALMPAPGNCDVVVAAELVEAARMVQRKLVDPHTTTLIASSHRAYTIAEKSHLGDGRQNDEELLELLSQSSKRLVTLDLESIAQAHNSVISASLLGAIAGAEVLPFKADDFRRAVERSTRRTGENLAAFEAALVATQIPPPDDEVVQQDLVLDPRISHLPAALQEVLQHAVDRLADYQDAAYVDEYLATISPIIEQDRAPYHLSAAVAQGLALWMTYEDTIRIADLKTCPERIRGLLGDEIASIVHVAEYMKPRLEEIAGTLPSSLGTRILDSKISAKVFGLLTGGLTIRSTNFAGYCLLRAVARLRPWRRRLLRHRWEFEQIADWLDAVQSLTPNYPLAVSLAHCQDLVAGYGDTHARGLRSYQRIAAVALQLVDHKQGGEIVDALHAAAQLDDSGSALTEQLAIQVERYDLDISGIAGND